MPPAGDLLGLAGDDNHDDGTGRAKAGERDGKQRAIVQGYQKLNLNSLEAPLFSGEEASKNRRERGVLMMLKTFNERAKGATILRKVVFTTMMVLAVPTVGMAQREEHPSRGRPAPGEFRGPHPGGPPGRPVPGEFRGPHPGGPPARFLYHGRPFNRVHIAPFVYPRGWAYRRWAIGAVLPALFLAPAYYYTGWAALGLPPPEPGFQWVRYGPDLLLVNVTTGQVVDTVYDAFY